MLKVEGQGHTLVQVCGVEAIHFDTGAWKSVFWFFLEIINNW